MRAFILLPLLALAMLPLSVAAAEIDHAKRYESCMRLAEKRPADGFEDALAWRDMGGGAAAEHCAAKALIGLGLHAEAGQRLQQVGNDPTLAPDLRADLLAQSGQAWLLASKPVQAEAVLTAALELQPGAPEYLVDRAQARAAIGDYEKAIADLDAAALEAPTWPDIYAFRAAAYRYLDRIPEARDDVIRALNLDSNHPEALLELGILKRLGGEAEHAREAWRRVLEIAPDSQAAKSARENIERLDLKSRQRDGGGEP